VFVYGSLTSRRVLEALLGAKTPSVAAGTMAPGVLQGFARYGIKGRVYPAIVPLEGAKVEGIILRGLDEDTMDCLDKFEDSDYAKTKVTAQLAEQPEVNEEVFAYVWKEELRHELTLQPWIYDQHFSPEEDEYVEDCKAFVAASYSWDE